MSLMRVSTKRSVEPKAPISALDVKYPYTWFDNNPGTKPTLSIELVTDNLESARKIIRKSITDNQIDVNVACIFLYLYGQTIKSKLEDDWTSYGVTIGNKGEEISPISLLEVKPVISKKYLPVADKVGPEQDSWMTGAVLGIYRLIKANVSEYKAAIAARINVQLVSLYKGAGSVSDVVDIYQGWQNDRSFNTLVAAYDMYFNRFPKHPVANLRISTTGSRHRDCAALMSYGYITSLLGMAKLTDLMDWVFVSQIGDDIDRMMLTKDELSDDFSYFPYHVDLGLVLKSAYSASANPHFFEWVHLTGALMRSQRSSNARHLTDARSADIFANSACLAYVHSSVVTFTKVYTETGDELEIQEDSGDEDQDDSAFVMKSKDPNDWVILMKTNRGTLPIKVRQFIGKATRGIRDPREGTIDHHLSIIAPNYSI